MNKKDYKRKVAEIGCLICGGPACLHHPRFCVGMGQRSSDFLTIPLCRTHHQDGGFGVAIHADKVAFEKNYGTEQELLAKVIQRLVR